MVRVIINSDDFGLNNEVNKAIAEAFEKGLISSTTSLVNFTASLNEASELVSQGRVPKESVGIHLNLSEGQPLDPSSLKCELLCSGDEFNGAIRNKPVFHLSKKDAKIIYLELEAQLLKFISTYGFTPTHIDGHHHIHTEWAIMSIVIRLAKKYNIDKIRLTRNIGHGISISKKILEYKYDPNTLLVAIYTVCLSGLILFIFRCSSSKYSF